MTNLISLVARILLALIFVLAGIGKLGAGYAATQAYMQSAGVSSTLLPLVIALEIGGGLALVVGLFARWAALALAGFALISAALFHHNFADQTQMVMFLKNLAMAGGLLLVFVHGAGGISIDAKRGA